ncbi:hypothetical protein AURDEDRAFT_123503 [Auricularia subglabra TFB-10046 SS5]|nr:hypothetical protein AURDEDRAFT_123503 [Auricularia subglabra TFB-10046 SS5]
MSDPTVTRVPRQCQCPCCRAYVNNFVSIIVRHLIEVHDLEPHLANVLGARLVNDTKTMALIYSEAFAEGMRTALRGQPPPSWADVAISAVVPGLAVARANEPAADAPGAQRPSDTPVQTLPDVFPDAGSPDDGPPDEEGRELTASPENLAHALSASAPAGTPPKKTAGIRRGRETCDEVLNGGSPSRFPPDHKRVCGTEPLEDFDPFTENGLAIINPGPPGARFVPRSGPGLRSPMQMASPPSEHPVPSSQASTAAPEQNASVSTAPPPPGPQPATASVGIYSGTFASAAEVVAVQTHPRSHYISMILPDLWNPERGHARHERGPTFRVPSHIHAGELQFYDTLFPLLGRTSFCANHYAIRRTAVGHGTMKCGLRGANSAWYAEVQFNGQQKLLRQIKSTPKFLPMAHPVCWRCMVPQSLHETADDCPFPDVVPQLIFLLFLHHREAMVSAAALPEVDEHTTLSQYWSMVKLQDADGYPNLIKYALWAVAHLGVDTAVRSGKRLLAPVPIRSRLSLMPPPAGTESSSFLCPQCHAPSRSARASMLCVTCNPGSPTQLGPRDCPVCERRFQPSESGQTVCAACLDTAGTDESLTPTPSPITDGDIDAGPASLKPASAPSTPIEPGGRVLTPTLSPAPDADADEAPGDCAACSSPIAENDPAVSCDRCYVKLHARCNRRPQMEGLPWLCRACGCAACSSPEKFVLTCRFCTVRLHVAEPVSGCSRMRLPSHLLRMNEAGTDVEPVPGTWACGDCCEARAACCERTLTDDDRVRVCTPIPFWSVQRLGTSAANAPVACDHQEHGLLADEYDLRVAATKNHRTRYNLYDWLCKSCRSCQRCTDSPPCLRTDPRPILRCDTCDKVLHMGCSGIKNKDGNWVCPKCPPVLCGVCKTARESHHESYKFVCMTCGDVFHPECAQPRSYFGDYLTQSIAAVASARRSVKLARPHVKGTLPHAQLAVRTIVPLASHDDAARRAGDLQAGGVKPALPGIEIPPRGANQSAAGGRFGGRRVRILGHLLLEAQRQLANVLRNFYTQVSTREMLRVPKDGPRHCRARPKARPNAPHSPAAPPRAHNLPALPRDDCEQDADQRARLVPVLVGGAIGSQGVSLDAVREPARALRLWHGAAVAGVAPPAPRAEQLDQRASGEPAQLRGHEGVFDLGKRQELAPLVASDARQAAPPGLTFHLRAGGAACAAAATAGGAQLGLQVAHTRVVLLYASAPSSRLRSCADAKAYSGWANDSSLANDASRSHSPRPPRSGLGSRRNLARGRGAHVQFRVQARLLEGERATELVPPRALRIRHRGVISGIVQPAPPADELRDVGLRNFQGEREAEIDSPRALRIRRGAVTADVVLRALGTDEAGVAFGMLLSAGIEPARVYGRKEVLEAHERRQPELLVAFGTQSLLLCGNAHISDNTMASSSIPGAYLPFGSGRRKEQSCAAAATAGLQQNGRVEDLVHPAGSLDWQSAIGSPPVPSISPATTFCPLMRPPLDLDVRINRALTAAA